MVDTGLPTHEIGRTGMVVTRLGYGSVELRNARPEARRVTDAYAGELLNAVLDAGINFLDTSPDYGNAEEMIGRWVSNRRDEYYLASKCGCLVGDRPGNGRGEGHQYTPENIVAGVEQSLRRMRTDYLDLVQFHGAPSRANLEEHGGLDALVKLKESGKVRFIGASAFGPDLAPLIDLGVFDEFQIPYSILQRAHEEDISRARAAGAGTVIRGGAARGMTSDEKNWNAMTAPVSEQEGRRIWETARLDDLLGGATRMQFTLRYTLTHPHIDTAIVGTSQIEHLHENLDVLRQGPLPADVYAEAKRRLDAAK